MVFIDRDNGIFSHELLLPMNPPKFNSKFFVDIGVSPVEICPYHIIGLGLDQTPESSFALHKSFKAISALGNVLDGSFKAQRFSFFILN